MDELQGTKKSSGGEFERTVGGSADAEADRKGGKFERTVRGSADAEADRECEIIIANEWMNCKEENSEPVGNSERTVEGSGTKKLSGEKFERTVGGSADAEADRECEVIIANEWMNCKKQSSDQEANLERTVGGSGDVEAGRECEIIIANEWMNCKNKADIRKKIGTWRWRIG
uniref:Retrotransposon protein n=1 Tax=Angiostrongylus cantonensis TaxID=6313 RepID=A0A0K0CZB2_ANGCA